MSAGPFPCLRICVAAVMDHGRSSPISDDAPTTWLLMMGLRIVCGGSAVLRPVVDLMTLGKRNKHHEHPYDYPHRHERLPG